MCWKQLTTDWLTVMSARYSLIDGSEIHFTDLELYKFNKRFYAWHLQLGVLPSATFVLWTALLHFLFIVLHKVSLLHADRGVWRGTSNGTLKDVSKWSKYALWYCYRYDIYDRHDHGLRVVPYHLHFGLVLFLSLRITENWGHWWSWIYFWKLSSIFDKKKTFPLFFQHAT